MFSRRYAVFSLSFSDSFLHSNKHTNAHAYSRMRPLSRKFAPSCLHCGTSTSQEQWRLQESMPVARCYEARCLVSAAWSCWMMYGMYVNLFVCLFLVCLFVCDLLSIGYVSVIVHVCLTAVYVATSRRGLFPVHRCGGGRTCHGHHTRYDCRCV